LVDKLVQVSTLNGHEQWVYIHLEVQGTRQDHFAERLFIYNYRLFDRFHRPVATLALLADNSRQWKRKFTEGEINSESARAGIAITPDPAPMTG
jgi:hypothetical protein